MSPLDRIQCAIDEFIPQNCDETVARHAMSIRADIWKLLPLLREWDDAQDALAIAEENEGRDEQDRCYETLQVAERALLAALRGEP